MRGCQRKSFAEPEPGVQGPLRHRVQGSLDWPAADSLLSRAASLSTLSINNLGQKNVGFEPAPQRWLAGSGGELR
jgi:hypothetical protein